MAHMTDLRLVFGVFLLGCFALAVRAAVPTVQLDVCGMHERPTVGSSMALTYDKNRNLCTVTARSMPDKASCTANSRDGGMMLQFPCQRTNSTKGVLGPSMNLWASYSGAPSSSGALALPGSTNSSCNIALLAPALYYHMRTPPVYTFGYQLQSLACSPLNAAAALGQLKGNSSVPKAGTRYTMTYGLWVIPSLPGPSASSFSTAAQRCSLVATAGSTSFKSSSTFPCSMTPMPKPGLGKGCCYDPLGAGRRLLMTPAGLEAYTQAALRRML